MNPLSKWLAVRRVKRNLAQYSAGYTWASKMLNEGKMTADELENASFGYKDPFDLGIKVYLEDHARAMECKEKIDNLTEEASMAKKEIDRTFANWKEYWDYKRDCSND